MAGLAMNGQSTKQPAAFDAWAGAMRNHFEDKAGAVLPRADGPLGQLADAMRYAVLDGGKRIRALLVYAAGVLTMAHPARLDACALAVEYVHAYSLVHDDMPCMDNDVLRRGKPTAHVKFGQALAMLAGDCLQPEAFRMIGASDLDGHIKALLMQELAEATGFSGMCGGQAVDLLSVGRELDLEALRAMHSMKTGCLIRAAVRMGALCGGCNQGKAFWEQLDAYASSLGLAFQVVDDILDATEDSATLGKTAGKDAADNKPTYVSLMGLEAARGFARECNGRALAALDALERDQGYGPLETLRLRELAHYLIGRTS